MTTKHTPGNWTLGKTGGTVVSDQPLPNYTARGGHDETRYYGGHLIAESIWREEDAHLIAAAPELLEALESLEREGWLKHIEARAVTVPGSDVASDILNHIAKVRAAIAKAKGEQQ